MSSKQSHGYQREASRRDEYQYLDLLKIMEQDLIMPTTAISSAPPYYVMHCTSIEFGPAFARP